MQTALGIAVLALALTLGVTGFFYYQVQAERDMYQESNTQYQAANGRLAAERDCLATEKKDLETENGRMKNDLESMLATNSRLSADLNRTEATVQNLIAQAEVAKQAHQAELRQLVAMAQEQALAQNEAIGRHFTLTTPESTMVAEWGTVFKNERPTLLPPLPRTPALQQAVTSARRFSRPRRRFTDRACGDDGL